MKNDSCLRSVGSSETAGMKQMSRTWPKALAFIAAVVFASSAWATSPTYYIYDESGHVIGEYNADGTPIQEHVYLGDRPVAVMQTTTVNGVQSSTVDYVSTDQLSTPRVITDASATVVWSWNSDPYGKGQPTGSITYNLRFPGQYYDAETGHYYNLNRDYDPGTGRYIESDPAGLEGGINTYAYVGNNPLKYSDPTGLWVPAMHRRMTREAALAAGCPDLAELISQLTAGVDDLPGSQDPANSAWHAMANGNESPEQAESDYDAYIQANTDLANQAGDLNALARVLHATEDSYSPAHRGFQPWNGFGGTSLLGLLWHGLQDTLANTQTYNDTVNAATQILDKYKEQHPCGCH